MIWRVKPSIEFLNSLSVNTLSENIGIEVTEIGDDYIIAKMPIDNRTVQPFRLLHGGASVALAETLGSVASACCIDITKKMAVGLEINANHLSSGREGKNGETAYVFGTVKPIRLGRNIQVWNIEIKDESQKLICISRLTISVIDR